MAEPLDAVGQEPDNGAELESRTVVGEPSPGMTVWRYRYRPGKRGQRTFTVYVTHVDGAEAERFNAKLAAALRDLLHWAAQQRRATSTKDSEHD